MVLSRCGFGLTGPSLAAVPSSERVGIFLLTGRSRLVTSLVDQAEDHRTPLQPETIAGLQAFVRLCHGTSNETMMLPKLLRRPLASTFALLAAGALLVTAGPSCSASGEDAGSSGSGASGAGNAQSSTDTGPGSGGSTSSFAQGTGGSTSGAGGGCAETSSEANAGLLPADIIMVVDNSGSMSDEAGFVQAAMNDFASIINASGIDAHVILIAADSNDDNGICVPTPMGSGSCPADENLPTYQHVAQFVGSSNALQLILDTYPQWQGSLRANATKTIAVITDDDSSKDAATFTSEIVALDPTFAGFKFSGIVAPYELSVVDTFQCSSAQPPNCGAVDPCCGINSTIGIFCQPLPADEGKVYKALISQTMGVLGNLCLQDFVPVFQDMATAVVNDAKVSCLYDIPEPDMGEDIDYDKVNVDYQADPNAPVEPIFYVPNGLAGCTAAGGWYYDDPSAPQQISLCPSTCEHVQLSPTGKVDVKFGCETIIK